MSDFEWIVGETYLAWTGAVFKLDSVSNNICVLVSEKNNSIAFINSITKEFYFKQRISSNSPLAKRPFIISRITGPVVGSLEDYI